MLKTMGSGNNLAINAAITNAGHTLSLISAGTLTQTSAGIITAAADALDGGCGLDSGLFPYTPDKPQTRRM